MDGAAGASVVIAVVGAAAALLPPPPPPPPLPVETPVWAWRLKTNATAMTDRVARMQTDFNMDFEGEEKKKERTKGEGATGKLSR
jgi:hypothetical protein